MVVMNLSNQDILELAAKYDEDHPWWTNEEKRIGDQLRRDNEFGMDTLKEIVHWKFLTSPPYKEKTVNRSLKNHTDEEVREITSWILPLPIKEDHNKVTGLRKLKGIGVSLASTILTFHNPQDYCVYDIRARQRVAKLHPFVNVLHHPNVAIDLAFQGTPKRSAATATSSIAMMQRAT